MFSSVKVSEGLPYPLGATLDSKGVNFAIFSANAEKIVLCLYDEEGKEEFQRINLPGFTDEVWHVRVDGLAANAVYGYRVYGAYEPHKGHRFNENKLLIDPYAKKLIGDHQWSNKLFGYDVTAVDQDLVKCEIDNAKQAIKCVVTDDSCLESSSIIRPCVPWEKTFIYETHVKGHTQLNLSVPLDKRGTFAGLSQPAALQYIKNLGITAIELLPVHSFIDEEFLLDNDLSNYWGYNSLNFFSPHNAYLSNGDRQEFLHFVNAAHDYGLEVILDVVYNHTAEGNHLGPTLSFRGIDNASYYSLASHDARFYVNDTGCGNTLNVKHPRVLQMVMDSLRYWVGTLGVDGFRFDLASVMGREPGGFNQGSGFFDAIKQDPLLASCKMIAEPWDIGPGGYQLGNYPSGWSEWNDRYRDTMRRFWNGDSGILPEFARRVHGSSDLFEHSGRHPWATINFITSHDGFTLNDLVSYNDKHNLANKENNNDGHHSNFSNNHGEEGDTENHQIVTLRERQKRNFIATLFLSKGTPMLLAGDELGCTRGGNNNAYCQDNEINWINWEKIGEAGRNLQAFTQYIIALRQQYPFYSSKSYIHSPDELENNDTGSVRWFSVTGEEMRREQWQEENTKVLGWMLENNGSLEDNENKKCLLLLLFNASDKTQVFSLPKHKSVTHWRYILDTYQGDGMPIEENCSAENKINLQNRSMTVLTAIFD